MALHDENRRLAHIIKDYWVGRGTDISDLQFSEEIIAASKQTGNLAVYCLRSNMINGYPPRRTVSLPSRSWSMPARAR